MKHYNAVLTIISFVTLGLGSANPVSEPSSSIYLTVDKAVYAPEDTIRVTLHNQSNAPVFLQGCSQLYLATNTGVEWMEKPMYYCFWEGLAVKINPGRIFPKNFMAKKFDSVHKFVALVYFDCLDKKPISSAECSRLDKIYSPEFVVAAGNLAILLPKSEYKWTRDDLGSSREIQATVRNNSDHTYYAQLGDSSDNNIDQDDLFITEDSGGFIERCNSSNGAWSAMPQRHRREGARLVALRPQKNYRLIVALNNWRGDETGQFRIKIEYFDQMDSPPGNSPHADYSQLFKILPR
jgi:hypothetical protein